MNQVAIGLGSSLGNRRRAIELAIRQLERMPGTTLWRTSRLYRTPPMRGGSARGWFLNAVAVFHTTGTPEQWLQACVDLEARADRRRAGHWGDRTLDLDLLIFGSVTSEDPLLTLPHPGIAHRPFVWLPLIEAWPDSIDPNSGIPWSDHAAPSGPRPVPVGAVARPFRAR